jgi:uncharacterized protein YigA (DUF484 family)
MTTTGTNTISLQDQQRARQRHRAELRRKLNTLLELADAEYRAQRWADFEQTKLAIRITLSDLASGKHDGRRVFATLPASPSTRRRGAGE